MFKTWIAILAVTLTAACAQMHQPYDALAIDKSPGKAVIYVVRSNPDLGPLPSQIKLNDQLVGSTHPGTYYRLEVPAGRHRLSGYGQDSGAMTIDVQADRVYFVQQKVSGTFRSPTPHSFFSVIDEAQGRAAMTGAWRAG